eukprot:SAG31_NODE_31040_length_373_cov_0.708029_2_plen_100_part_01
MKLRADFKAASAMKDQAIPLHRAVSFLSHRLKLQNYGLRRQVRVLLENIPQRCLRAEPCPQWRWSWRSNFLLCLPLLRPRPAAVRRRQFLIGVAKWLLGT